ncbi:MAG: polyprenyl diphosphate synthase [Candidatus Woesearchaeota archaeon]
MAGGPKHIAIILDGNRRYARKSGIQPWMGHEAGAKKVELLFEWAIEFGIKELTLYSFSMENFKRDKSEVDFLMRLFQHEFEKVKKDKRIDERGIRIRFIGRLGMFPEKLQNMMREITEKTSKNSNLTVNFAMAYGGQAEIVDATKRIINDVAAKKLNLENFNEESFGNYLYMKDEPDMVIRTGGAMRLSNFLLYQSSYSELFFVEKLWPEFEKEDLVKCIEEFGQRERRFGR